MNGTTIPTPLRSYVARKRLVLGRDVVEGMSFGGFGGTSFVVASFEPYDPPFGSDIGPARIVVDLLGRTMSLFDNYPVFVVDLS